MVLACTWLEWLGERKASYVSRVSGGELFWKSDLFGVKENRKSEMNLGLKQQNKQAASAGKGNKTEATKSNQQKESKQQN